VTVIANHQWPRADGGPYIGVTALLSYTRLILEPDL
jgi:hypothetical protein